MKKSPLCELLGIEYPVVQAPMNWITGAELVAAVSNAGGLGVIGPNAGERTETKDVGETVSGCVGN
jgi:enoyl-[acyl-carrier protein] reductase II